MSAPADDVGGLGSEDLAARCAAAAEELERREAEAKEASLRLEKARRAAMELNREAWKRAQEEEGWAEKTTQERWARFLSLGPIRTSSNVTLIGRPELTVNGKNFFREGSVESLPKEALLSCCDLPGLLAAVCQGPPLPS